MGVQLNLSAANQIAKGSVIYSINEPIESIGLVIKGRVIIGNRGSKVIAGSGSFLGVTDVYAGKYKNNYIALDDLVIFAFPAKSMDDIVKIFSINKDYRGFMTFSLSRNIGELSKVYLSLKDNVNSLYKKLEEIYSNYVEIGRKSGIKVLLISELEALSQYESEFNIEQKNIEYYNECAKIPLEIQKPFYSYSDIIPLYHVEEQADIISKLSIECIGISSHIQDMFSGLMNESESCLYKNLAKLGMEIKQAGGDNNEVLTMVDESIELVNITETLFLEKVGVNLSVDRAVMEDIYFLLLTGIKDKELSTEIQMKYSENDSKKAIDSLKGSLQKILLFSELEEEKCREFEEYILDFVNLKDKLSTEDDARALRKKIGSLYYIIYEKVFLKTYRIKYVERIIDMFLKFGYMDERLLTKEQTLELYYLKEDVYEGTCQIYNIKDWLIEIYEGRKEPSKSEFDLDYNEAIREMKKTRKISPDEEKEYSNSLEKKLSYEIENMFRYTNRITNGQASTFVPILYKEAIVSDLQKVYATAQRINKNIDYILQIDYSIFHREVLFYDEAKGIKKEYIMEQVFPEIILMPNYGYNAIMWQEITGKKRNTPGRILLPIFTDGSMREQLIKVMGRFRWELCRCIQGTSWNDIQNKSLTSEYSDYIQFYRKNRELSEEKREKLKMQIQKGRNNLREIFTIDYELWIKSESKGAIRLNKVIRELMSTHCPFSKELRDKLSSQPLFEESMARFNREKAKKVKDIEFRHHALEKEGIEIPEVLLETQRYYRDL